MLADHLIITGSNGYIGARLAEIALAQGRIVTVLGRRPALTGTRHLFWTLGDSLPEEAVYADLPADRQALVHLAHDWDAEDGINISGSELLFSSARAAGVGTRVFISSQSAREHALNRYGRMKWMTEQRVAADTSLRVGLVYGGPAIAMYGLLCRLSKLPVLPMVDPGRTVQPIHRDEVVAGIIAAADGKARGILALAGTEPIAFATMLKMLARTFYGRSLPILPVPLKVALIACDITVWLPGIPTVDRERVLGLASTISLESAADLARLDVRLLPLETRLAAEPQGRRALLAEAHAFMRQAIGVQPAPTLLRRYLSGVAGGAIVRPQVLPRWFEPIAGTSALATRLRIGARLAEASARGEASLAGRTRASRLLRLVAALALEAAMMPTRLLGTLVAR